MHQHARRQTVKVASSVGVIGEHTAQAQGFGAYFQFIANLQIQRDHQARFGPDFSGARAGTRFLWCVGFGSAPQFAAQRIKAIGCLDAGQLNAFLGSHHAGKLHRLCVIEAQLEPRVYLFLAGRRAAAQAQVGGEKLAGTQQHGVIQACAEITDGAAGGHRDQQGEEQHPQLAGAGIAQQLAGSERKQASDGHAFHQGSTRSIRCPASRRIRRWQRCARRSSWVTSTRVVPRSWLS